MWASCETKPTEIVLGMHTGRSVFEQKPPELDGCNQKQRLCSYRFEFFDHTTAYFDASKCLSEIKLSVDSLIKQRWGFMFLALR